jgi:hypothetical protein
MRKFRLALLPIVLCLSMGFGSPYLPGVVSFAVEESVNGVRLERPRANAVRPASPPMFAARALDFPATDKVPRRNVIAVHPARRGVVPPRDPRGVASEPASSPDDHQLAS